MKKSIFIILLVLNVAFAFAQRTNNGWQHWQKTSCYSNISFRLMEAGKNGEQFVWKIQFRNDYNNLISFNYHVTDKLQQYDITTKRKTLTAKQISDEVEVFTTEEDIYLLVDKVSMTPYPENYADCDGQ